MCCKLFRVLPGRLGDQRKTWAYKHASYHYRSSKRSSTGLININSVLKRKYMIGYQRHRYDDIFFLYKYKTYQIFPMKSPRPSGEFWAFRLRRMDRPTDDPSNLLHTTHSSHRRSDSTSGRQRPERRTEKYLITQFVYSKTNITGW